MKIEATCGTCQRTFILEQIGATSEAPGRCPYCGARFARHYRGTLVDAVDDTERAAAEFLASLDRLSAMETGFTIDAEGVLEAFRKHIETRSAQKSA